MTREEIADKLEELAKGIREGKELQESKAPGLWGNVSEYRMLHDLNNGVFGLRIKPEPEVIPFTANDWIIFANSIVLWNGRKLRVHAWTGHGIELIDLDNHDTRRHFIAYDYALSIGVVFAVTGKPFGKQVQP